MVEITKEYLQREYVELRRSPKQLAKECGVHHSTIHNYVKRFNLHRVRYDDITDKQFGKWLVEGLAHSNGKWTTWWCKCACGNRVKVIRASLVNGDSTQCKRCADIDQTSKEEYKQCFYTKARLHAKRRGIDFKVSREELYDIFLKQNRKCALTGLPLMFAKTDNDQRHGKTTASLDRIDSQKPYILENVQWVHKDVNKMKQNFSQPYFVNICKLIAAADPCQ